MIQRFPFRASGFRGFWAVLFGWCLSGAHAADNFARLQSDRAAIERVYYLHRLGEKPPFEQALPPTTLERLVRDDLHKEAVLKQVYGVEVTDAQIEAEVQRINATTKAPDILAELQAALGRDPARFAQTVARPLVVDRLLRDRFDNDDSLHAFQRRTAEQARAELLAAKKAGDSLADLQARLKRTYSNDVSEITWRKGLRASEKPSGALPDANEIRPSLGSTAPILSPTLPEQIRYFEDLPPELQTVLRVQLRQPGDVSAVVELPNGFLLYLATEVTDDMLRVTSLTLRKRSYEQWLTETTAPMP